MGHSDKPHKGLSPLADGLWFIADAAFALAQQEGMATEGRQDLARRMAECAALPTADNHRLATRHLESKLEIKPGTAVGLLSGVYPSDVNAWLASIGAPYRWTSVDDAMRITLQSQRAAVRKIGRKKPPPPERRLHPPTVPGGVTAAITRKKSAAVMVSPEKAARFKSVVLVAQEAAAKVMIRDAKDHGEEGSVRRTLVDAWRAAAARDFLHRIGFHLKDGELRAISVINGAPYDPRMRGEPPTDSMWMLTPEEEVKALTLLGQREPDTRPVFMAAAMPKAIPALLLQLPPDTEILVRHLTGEGTARAGAYVAQLETLMERQAQGWFTLDEAGEVMEEAGRGKALGKDGWIAKLSRAAQRGDLPMHEPGSLARIEYGLRLVSQGGNLLPGGVSYHDDRRVRSFLEWAHSEDLNRWLDANEPRLPFRFARVTADQPSNSETSVDTLAVPRVASGALVLPAGTKHLQFGELADLIADATWPGDGFSSAAASPGIQKELVRAVDDGELRVLSPLTFGPHEFPVGDALRLALVSVDALQKWASATRNLKITVEDLPTKGTGPTSVDDRPQKAKSTPPTDGIISQSLPTSDIIQAFADVGMSAIAWRQAIGKNLPAWLKACRASHGKTGASPVEGRWFPLRIAEALVTGKSRNAGAVPAAKLDAAFRRPLLRQFATDWAGLRADHPAWGD